ncbi:MAG: hypothetical protein H7336_11210 [Bacteriovorax sp.]|nr:hypothetical protein [Bacteriovorax sp.]
MTKGILLVAVMATLSFGTAFSCDSTGNGGFAPENNMKIEVGDKAASNATMTNELFLSTVARVSSVYESIVKGKGGTLVMNNKWDDSTVNASAQQSGKTWQVNMYGGLARHPLVTTDGFMMVVCHELGHHLGGAPKKGGFGSAWASNEGQADYFAGLKCMRRVLQNDDNIAVVSKMTIDAEAKLRCESIYKSSGDIALCERITMAGKSLAMLLGDLGGSSNVAFTTPDVSKVAKTNDAHPAAQCRLDTYFQSTLCDKAISDEVDNKDATKGVCLKKDGYAYGPRPLCWYKPGSNE